MLLLMMTTFLIFNKELEIKDILFLLYYIEILTYVAHDAGCY
jgi:hypothetical protein